MKKFPNRLWLSVLLLGWLFDFLFWKHTPGISFAIFACATLITGFILLKLEGIDPARHTLWLFPFALFFIIMTFVRAEQMSAFLAHAFTLLTMILITVTYQGGRWLEYGLADYFTRFFDLLGSLIARPLIFWGETRKTATETTSESKPKSQAWPMVRGILLAIPVVVFFASLLASADLVFAERINGLVELLRLENLPEYIFRIIYICFLAYALAGTYLHAASRSKDETLIGKDKPIVPQFFGFTEAAVILGSVATLFLLFVIIQFQYFFGGRTNISLDGYTYAEYARRGFGELVAVAFFSLVLFLGLSMVVKRETNQRQRIFSGLGVVLFLLVGVMLVSAYQRLVLYETAYGFTRLRAYTHVFIIWLAILLAASVVLDVLNRQRAFAIAGVLAAVGFSISLLLMNVDGFIVRQNIQRVQQGHELDVSYLATLSSDAVPALVDFYNTPSLDQPTRERIGAVLACLQSGSLSPDQRSDTSWQAFHLSDYQARNALRSLNAALSPYKTNNQNWPPSVTTPSGKNFECYSYVD